MILQYDTYLKNLFLQDLSGKNSNLYGTFCVSVIKGVPVAERMREREEDLLGIQLQPVSVLRRWNPQTVLLNLAEENNLALCRARTQVQR